MLFTFRIQWKNCLNNSVLQPLTFKPCWGGTLRYQFGCIRFSTSLSNTMQWGNLIYVQKCSLFHQRSHWDKRGTRNYKQHKYMIHNFRRVSLPFACPVEGFGFSGNSNDHFRAIVDGKLLEYKTYSWVFDHQLKLLIEMVSDSEHTVRAFSSRGLEFSANAILTCYTSWEAFAP